MAWGFARYLGALADAGKRVKALPAYANAWLGPQPGQALPGQYPSGGPTARMGGVCVSARQPGTSSRPTSTFQTARR